MKSRVRKVSGMGQSTADCPPQGKNDLVKVIHVLTINRNIKSFQKSRGLNYILLICPMKVRYNRAVPDYLYYAPVICIHCPSPLPIPMRNSGDYDFPSIPALLNIPRCGDNWIVKAQLFTHHPPPSPPPPPPHTHTHTHHHHLHNPSTFLAL